MRSLNRTCRQIRDPKVVFVGKLAEIVERYNDTMLGNLFDTRADDLRALTNHTNAYTYLFTSHYDSFCTASRTAREDFYRHAIDLFVSYELPDAAYEELLDFLCDQNNRYIPDSAIVQLLQQRATQKAEREFAHWCTPAPTMAEKENVDSMTVYFQQRGFPLEKARAYAHKFGYRKGDNEQPIWLVFGSDAGILTLRGQEKRRFMEEYLAPYHRQLLEKGKEGAAVALAKGYTSFTKQVVAKFPKDNNFDSLVRALSEKTEVTAEDQDVMFDYLSPLLNDPKQHQRLCGSMKEWGWWPSIGERIVKAFIQMNQFHPDITAEGVTQDFIQKNELDLLQRWVELVIASQNQNQLKSIRETLLTHPNLDLAKELLVKIGRTSCDGTYPFKDATYRDFIAKRQHQYALQMLHPMHPLNMHAAEVNIERFRLAKICMDRNDLDTAAQCFLDLQTVDQWTSCRNSHYNYYKDCEEVKEARTLAHQLMVQLSERGQVERARRMAPHANPYTGSTSYAELMAIHYVDQNRWDEALQIARLEKSAAAVQHIIRSNKYRADYFIDLTRYDKAMEIIQSIPDWQTNCKNAAHSVISDGIQEGRVTKGLEEMKLFTWSPLELLLFVGKLEDVKDLVNAKAILQTIPVITDADYEECRVKLRKKFGLD